MSSRPSVPKSPGTQLLEIRCKINTALTKTRISDFARAKFILLHRVK